MKLEVGMRLYCGSGRYYVTRVTPKRAYITVKTLIGNTYEIEFNREQSDPRYMHIRGDKGYGRSLYQLETPELIAKYERNRLVSKANKINMNILTDDQLNRIMEIVSEVKK